MGNTHRSTSVASPTEAALLISNPGTPRIELWTVEMVNVVVPELPDVRVTVAGLK